MSRTDLIADIFTMMRNANMIKKDNLDVPSSKTAKSIMQILKKEGYIENYKYIEDKKQGLLRIYLKYTLGKPAIRNLKKISKPGLRVYTGAKQLPRVLRGRGIAIVSTSKGMVSDNAARELGLGGEIIAYVW